VIPDVNTALLVFCVKCGKEPGKLLQLYNTHETMVIKFTIKRGEISPYSIVFIGTHTNTNIRYILVIKNISTMDFITIYRTKSQTD